MEFFDTPPKVLAVDDNPRNIQVIGSILRGADYRIGFAINGRQALDLLQEAGDYDLVLLDVNMPVMNGFEACACMREDAHLRDIPVIFLTALTDTDDIVRGFEAGAQDYVTKPVNARELLSRVKTQIELKKSRDILRNMNAILEEQVQARTAALAQANHQLSQANAELQHLDDAKVEFLRIISHEINTPLNGIIGFTSLLKEELETSEFGDMLEQLELSAHRLERFAHVSLHIAELRTGSVRIAQTHVPLDTLLETTFAQLSDAITTADVRLRLERNAAITLVGSSDLLTICLVNILDNAVRFSPSGGEILIRATVDDGMARIAITDQGPGFTDEALRKLFRLFAPGERHIDKNPGLNLALSKLIIDAHGGSIEVMNTPERGATVTLVFPMQL